MIIHSAHPGIRRTSLVTIHLTPDQLIRRNRPPTKKSCHCRPLQPHQHHTTTQNQLTFENAVFEAIKSIKLLDLCISVKNISSPLAFSSFQPWYTIRIILDTQQYNIVPQLLCYIPVRFVLPNS